jgi:hypothetical protein
MFGLIKMIPQESVFSIQFLAVPIAVGAVFFWISSLINGFYGITISLSVSILK